MTEPRRLGDLAPSTYPGSRLGLPQTGRGSVAKLPRRILALMADWLLATLLALLAAPYASSAHSIWTLVIFAAMQVVFIPTVGGSVGHRIFGMRVHALSGRWVGLWRPLVRTALVVVVLPCLVWDSDHRGFQDVVPGTVLVRT